MFETPTAPLPNGGTPAEGSRSEQILRFLLRYGDGASEATKDLPSAERYLRRFFRILTKERPRSSSAVRPLFSIASASVIAPQFQARRK